MISTSSIRYFNSLNDFIIPEGFIYDSLHQNYQDEDGSIHLYIVPKNLDQTCSCPHCGSSHTTLHGQTTRTCQIFPISGHPTYLHIRQRRRLCGNSDCLATSFMVSVPGFRFFQRRSDELTLFIFTLSLFCSDIAAQLICNSLGIRISHDSIRRILSHIQIQDKPDIKVIGVDDVCLKKGQSYYTVIYDGEDHHLLALLEGRDGKELKKWLETHPKVEWIARDRASAYARAIEEVLPNCYQVADRFHLFQNLMDRLKTIFKSELPINFYIQSEQLEEELLINKELESLDYNNEIPTDKDGNEISFIDKSEVRNSKAYRQMEATRKKKYERISKVRKEFEDRKSEDKQEIINLKRELCNDYEMSLSTLNKYIKMTLEEVEKVLEINEQKKKDTPINPYLNIIFKMCRDKISPKLIYHYVISKGYNGSTNSLINHIRGISFNNGFGSISRNFLRDSYVSENVVQIKRRDVLKRITIQDEKKIDETETGRFYEQIEAQYPILRSLEDLWHEFHEVIMGNNSRKLDEFINKYEKKLKERDGDLTENRELEAFIKGIKKDIAPVKNAISSKLNSGFVEGGNCRYKSIKRNMFGRAGHIHLFRKSYAVFSITRNVLKPQDLLSDWFLKPIRTIWPKRKIN